MKAIETIWLFAAFLVVKIIAINYPNDPGCDPRCFNSDCDVLFSYQSCVSGCKPYPLAPSYTVNYRWVGTNTCASYCPGG
jgi:hypothetical protein